jgi:hypothetical protein
MDIARSDFMSKHPVSAAGGALPAESRQSKHPDAALFTLAEECIAAARARDMACDKMNDASKNLCWVHVPRPVFKTERDADLKLYAGPGVGAPYDSEEIAAIRVFCRMAGKEESHSLAGSDAYFRGVEILDAWANWQEAREQEENRTGMTTASRVYCAADDKFAAIAGTVAKTPAATIEGVLAKTRAMRTVFPNDIALEEDIRRGLRRYGADTDAVALSLARDLINLIKSEALARRK